jgi:hypothetical protein
MRTEGYTLPAVDTYKWLIGNIKVDRIHGAGVRTLPASNTEIFPYQDPAALSLRKSAGGASQGAGGGIAGEADICLESGRQSSGGSYANSSRIPGQSFVHQPGTGQRAGMAAYASFHSWGD